MMRTLFVFIFSIVLVSLFVLFNVGNVSDVSIFGLYIFTAVPVFFTITIAYTLGLVTGLFLLIISRILKKRKKEERNRMKKQSNEASKRDDNEKKTVSGHGASPEYDTIKKGNSGKRADEMDDGAIDNKNMAAAAQEKIL